MSPTPAPTEPAVITAPPCVTPADQAQWFKQEVHPYGGQLKAWLHGSYPSARREVDDIVQESYLRIWKAKASQPIASAKAFLFMVARHLALDVIRKDRNAPLETGSDLASLRVLDTSPNAAQAYSIKETIDHLADAIVALPERYRAVVVLHKLQSLPQKQVAEQLGLSPRTVENYCFRGLKLCEEYLKAKGIHGFFG